MTDDTWHARTFKPIANPRSRMADRIDIRDETRLICEKLGHPANRVAELRWTPGEMVARIYLDNEDGKMYVDPETNLAAMETRTFKVVA